MATDTIDALSTLGLASPQTGRKQELGQDDFLRLMVSQLQNQNPLKPLENTEFLGQLAQFSVVSGIQEMQQSLVSLSDALQANQALQGTTLLGHSVLVPGDRAELGADGGVTGAVDAPAGTQGVVVEVVDGAGQIVRTLQVDAQGAGLAAFTWDGLDATGARAASGTYSIRARAHADGHSVAAETLVAARVETVTLGGASGLVLNLSGLGPVSLGQVRQIL